MFRSFQLYRICDQAFVCFKVCRAQIPKRFNVKFPLESSESIGTFLTPVIVCGVNQAVFYFAVCDDDFGVFQFTPASRLQAEIGQLSTTIDPVL